MNIAFTPAAEKFIRRMLKFDGKPGYGFRLMVSPGGCSGMSAEFGVQAAPGDGEKLFEHGDLEAFPSGAKSSVAGRSHDRLRRNGHVERICLHRSEKEELRLLDYRRNRFQSVTA